LFKLRLQNHSTMNQKIKKIQHTNEHINQHSILQKSTQSTQSMSQFLNQVTHELCEVLLINNGDNDKRKQQTTKKGIFLYDSRETPYNSKFDSVTNTFLYNPANENTISYNDEQMFTNDTTLFPVPIDYINGMRNYTHLLDLFEYAIQDLYLHDDVMYKLCKISRYETSILIQRSNCVIPTFGLYLELTLKKLIFINKKG
jgi:hypothetical protein